jgi:plastocyanin
MDFQRGEHGMQYRHHAITMIATLAAVLTAAACGSSGSGSNSNGGGTTSGPVSGHSDTVTGVGSSATSGGGGGGGGGGNPYSTAPMARTRSAAEPYFFTPTPDTIAVGTTLNFVFQDVNHTVTFDMNPGTVANISSIAAGGVANADSTRTFSTAGTYTYHCSIHPYMTGTIVVH